MENLKEIFQNRKNFTVHGSIIFSVIIPTYNQAEYLPTALQSLLDQTYSNWEAVIVNDGSIDNTVEVLQQYSKLDNRFSFYTKENGGAGSALNEALKHVKGEWICWLSSDDLFEKDKLKHHYDEIIKAPEIKFFYSHYYILDDKEQMIYSPDYNSQTGFYIAPYQVLGFFNGNYIHGLSVAIHRDVFKEVGVFNENYKYAQDYDLWLRIVSKFEARYIDYRTVITRVYPEQITTAFPEWGILDSARAAIEFINTHTFDEFFPRLSLNRIEDIIYAVEQTIYLSLDKEIFLYKGNFSTALLERLREWLFYDCPKELKSQINTRITVLIDTINQLGSDKNLPETIRKAIQNLKNATSKAYKYLSHDFVQEIVNANKAGNNKEKIELYLQKAIGKKRTDFKIEEYLPEIIFEEENIGREAKIADTKIEIDKAKNVLKMLITSSAGVTYTVSNQFHWEDELKTLSIKDPVTDKNIFICSKTIFDSWKNNYDFLEIYNALSKKLINGEKPSIAFTCMDSAAKEGGTIKLFKFADWFSQMGHRVTIYTNTVKPNWRTFEYQFVSEQEHLKRYALIKEDILIFYSINELPIILGTKSCKQKLIFHLCQGIETFHYSDKTVNSLLCEKPYFKLLHDLPVGRITVSKSIDNYFQNTFNQKTFLIQNGIDNKYISYLPKRKDYSVGTVKILFVGYPGSYLKGFEVLIKALRTVAKKLNQNKNFELAVIDGSTNETVSSDFFSIKIKHKICTSIECMIKEYEKAHIYVNASLYEGFGLPTLEAMAVGTPVIQSDNQGLDGIIKDGENCLIFSPGDYEALAEKIEILFSDESLRNKLIENGKGTSNGFSELAQRVNFERVFSKLFNALKNDREDNEQTDEVEEETEFSNLALVKKQTNIDKSKKPIDIIFLTHNRLRYFVSTIEHLIKNTRYPYRIIIVDNNSDNEFVEFLKRSKILYDKIIFNKENYWTKAFQQGIEVSKSDPFIVSDPDILVPDFDGKCWLERLIDLHKNNNEIGLLALNLDSSNKPEKLPDVYVSEKTTYNDEIILSNVGTVMQSIKRKYFDFSYKTDWETCEGIRQNGGKVGFAKNIVAYHLGWNEEKDYPDYIVEKYKYFKNNYNVDTYKMYTTDKSILNKMDGSNININSNYYGYSRPEVQRMVNLNSKIILDVGCGAGRMASEIKRNLDAEVWGIEFVSKQAEIASGKIDKVLVGKVEDNIENLPDNYFDTIIFADVLEHLLDPDEIINRLKRKLTTEGEIVVSIPNIRHWTVIKALLEGTWQYEDAGILDRTHLKFFTFETASRMLLENGFRIERVTTTKINEYAFSEKFITALKSEGFKVDELKEKSQHYQYIFKAVKINTEKLVSIIVPVYNQAEYTSEMQISIAENTEMNYELIFIDNNSNSETKLVFNELNKLQNVRILNNSKNQGFPTAVNQGIKEAKGEYILIANNDIVVTKGWLERLLKAAETDSQIGIVGVVSNSVSGVQQVKNTDYNSIEEMHKYAEKVAIVNKGKVLEFPRVAFLCTLIKREVIEKIGGLDERFSPGNYEDDDFCLRAQLAGFKTVIAQDVFIHHYGSKSFKADGNEKYAKLLETNKQKFIDKWGATPDDIWLHGKNIKSGSCRIDLYCSINKGSVEVIFNKALEMINNENYESAKKHLDECIELLSGNSKSNIEIKKVMELRQKIEQIIITEKRN